MRRLLQVVVQTLARSAAFAVGYATLGVCVGAIGAFWGASDPRFSAQIAYEMYLVGLAMLLALSSGAFLIATVITLFAVPRRFSWRNAGVTAGAGALCMLITNLLFVLRLGDIAPALVVALGATLGAVCVKRTTSR